MPEGLSVGGGLIAVGAAGTGNTLRVDGNGVSGGAVVTNIAGNGLGIGGGDTSGVANGNTLIITNGGKLFVTSGQHPHRRCRPVQQSDAH